MLNEILKLSLAVFIPAWFFVYLHRKQQRDRLPMAIARLEQLIAKEREISYKVMWEAEEDAAFVRGLEHALDLLKEVPTEQLSKALIPLSQPKQVERCTRCAGWGYVPILGTRYKEDPCQACNGKKVLSATEEN